MFKLVRDSDVFDSIVLDPSLPVFCDTETAEDEGFTVSGEGLYGRVRLFQIFQNGWDEALLIDNFFVPLQLTLNLVMGHHLVFHNASYDLHTVNLKTDSTWYPRMVDDTLYLSRLKYFTKTKFSFYDCLEYAGVADDLIMSIDKKEQQKSKWSGPLSIIQKTYAAADVVYLAKLYDSVKDHVTSTIYKLDIQNLQLAVDYSRHGMPINQDTVMKLKKDYHIKLEGVLDDLPVNPRSSKQCCEYLESSSSAAEILKEMVMDGSIRAKKIQDARHYYKSIEYLNAYDRPVVKGFFNPSAARAGRFSCVGGKRHDHVNLQQMPEHLHSVVEAPEGFEIVYSDYSGLELRMAASYVGDPVMSGMMINGSDMHTETAKYIFSKDEVTDEERTVAKTFNFSLIYGGGVKTVRQTLKLDAGVIMTFQEVKNRIEMWFDMYVYFKEWHRLHKRQMDVYGYVDVETALGRLVRAYMLTDSLNIPIQGSSVEVTKTSLGLLCSRYPDVYIIDTIHDSNILLAKTEEVEMWGNRLTECMTDAWEYVIQDLAVPEIPMPRGFEHGPVWKFH